MSVKKIENKKIQNLEYLVNLNYIEMKYYLSLTAITLHNTSKPTGLSRFNLGIVFKSTLNSKYPTQNSVNQRRSTYKVLSQEQLGRRSTHFIYRVY